MRIIIGIIVVAILFFIGCTFMPAAKQSKTTSPGDQPEQVILPEAAETPPVVVEEKDNPPKEADFQALADQYVPKETSDGGGQTRGYRVQIFTTENAAVADSFANQAERKLDMPVYKVYSPPYYKIRIGNCGTLDEAEELEKEIIKAGFETFIVRDVID